MEQLSQGPKELELHREEEVRLLMSVPTVGILVGFSAVPYSTGEKGWPHRGPGIWHYSPSSHGPCPKAVPVACLTYTCPILQCMVLETEAAFLSGLKSLSQLNVKSTAATCCLLRLIGRAWHSGVP